MLESIADVGVMLTLTLEPRRGTFDAGLAVSRIEEARWLPDDDDEAPKPYAWNELLLWGVGPAGERLWACDWHSDNVMKSNVTFLLNFVIFNVLLCC